MTHVNYVNFKNMRTDLCFFLRFLTVYNRINSFFLLSKTCFYFNVFNTEFINLKL